MKSQESLQDVYSELENKTSQIVNYIEMKLFEIYPFLLTQYTKEGLERTREDIKFHLEYLKAAIQFNDKAIFLDYVAWLKIFFANINLKEEYYLASIRLIKDAVAKQINNVETNSITDVIDFALNRFGSLPTYASSHILELPENKHSVLAHLYLNALLRRERETAEQLIFKAIGNGTHIKEIYMNVFQPVQYEIGRLWQHNKLSVAMEHYCTAATQFISTRFYDQVFSSTKNGNRLISLSVAGELHEFGIRMVSDFFEMDGWSTYYLGANTPNNSLIELIHEIKPHVVAISSAIPSNVKNIKSIISTVRNEFSTNEIKIIVGGIPFNRSRDLWRQIDADGFAPDAQNAVFEANKLISTMV